MARELPDLSEPGFASRLAAAVSHELDARAVGRMYAHYCELRRWNRRVALVGGGVADAVVERLFAESVAVLELLDDSVRSVVDVGSGAGFPGLVIAAARPDVRVVLVEARERKWAFLRAAADRASLSCDCLNARVAAALPAGVPTAIDRVTVRALWLEPAEMDALADRLSERGSFLLWSSSRGLPPGYRVTRSVELAAGRGQILELRPSV